MRGSSHKGGWESLKGVGILVLAVSCAYLSRATARTAAQGASAASNYRSSTGGQKQQPAAAQGYGQYDGPQSSEAYRGDATDPYTTPPHRVNYPGTGGSHNHRQHYGGYDRPPSYNDDEGVWGGGYGGHNNPSPPPPPPPPHACKGCGPGVGCAPCPQGTFSGGNASDTAADSTPCEPCPFLTTTSGPGATNVSECHYDWCDEDDLDCDKPSELFVLICVLGVACWS